MGVKDLNKSIYMYIYIFSIYTYVCINYTFIYTEKIEMPIYELMIVYLNTHACTPSTKHIHTYV